MTPASTRTRDRWTEARTGPGHLYPRNGKRPHAVQGTCATTQRAGPHEDPLTASSGGPPKKVTGHQEGSRGLISPSRRMFSTAPVRGLSSWCLRVSPKSASAQQCPACAFGQKTTLRAPRWRSPRGTAPNRMSRPAAQRLAATEEWRPGRRPATWLPEEEQATQRHELSG